MTIFLDTNVWIDFLLERKPFYTLAASVLSYADSKSYKLCVSTLTVVNAHYICCERFRMPTAIVISKMEALSDLLTICSVSQEDISQAYSDGWADFEDSVQHNAALRAGASCIVTRNKKDFAQASLPVMTPEEFVQTQKNQ